MIGDYYRNTKTISILKALTKDWKNIDGVNVCPECFAKRKENK